ncbi:Ca2+/H+ antiporter, cation antiporter, membrane protein [Volvox carteri f. nagariensis]|uniref:Ca2+/H+ antiporter, cation antiporter, membrane protein n=1 Tax=Volvox carteri f. nagariensis TaxID=3068 RepID=D8U183_VOLCA|nr:Ca2+/H+ antiporter, cation antiporter, membrane protein [Volvox carteri f. nagariensis]EFJ46589.1 Ca2+/H+ antiporter, cation antiporter, membrane protein [Volvox carteri f. nagariensis]|eukprot:XP_002952446.1 Ca2+/H+ antiporter, cation antiporter, membrane protein [Volvox carteri f. nagariensis]
MLLVAERFFCPSLELISEYLRLPPCVAGATLLSFGNGAPDVFTQLAAISQGDSDSSSPGAIAMALSEPLGSGLFVGNIVFGLVVLFSGLQEVGAGQGVDGPGDVTPKPKRQLPTSDGVKVQRSYFLKDCLFYLGGVVTVFAFLIHGVVMVWEVALLAGYYLAFIVATILLSRGDEPVHADPRLHEVPHRLKPLDSFMRESSRRVRDFSRGASHVSQASGIDTDAEAPLLPGSAASTSPTKQQQLKQQQLLQRGLTLERIEETAPAGAMSGELPVEEAGAGASTADADMSSEDDEDVYDFLMERFRGAAAAGFGDVCSSSYCGVGPDGGVSFSRRQPGDGGGGGSYKPPPPVLSPPAAAAGPPFLMPSAFHATGRTYSGDSVEASTSYKPCGGGGGLGFCRGSVDATSSLRREVSGKPPGRMELLWRRVERPGLALLSLFMPRVAVDTHARYRKTCAVLLPMLLPTLRWWLVSTGAGLLVAVFAARYYPKKGHLHGYAAGVATVVVFCEAMALLNCSAGELVSAAVALGQIYGISPSLLGATLLAWGNSVSDLVSNITLAKDGLPSMAITACFASPMFVLLAGLVTSLTYATRHGTMELPKDLSLRVLYGCSSSILLMWALVVPFVFRFRLTRRVGVLAVAVYLVYQSVYIWAVVHDSRV